jgi:sugar phosphate isomerase/epimerase
MAMPDTSSAAFTLSAFGDEIADDLHEQLRVLKDLRINYLELRGAWGKNVLRLDDEDVAAVRRACRDQQIAVSCIGSPIGKSPISAPVEQELANLTRLFEIGEALDTRRVRIFSFYPPEGEPPEAHVDEAIARLGRLADLAGREGFLLLLENEKGVVGDTPERCAEILERVGSPHLRFVWDPANFVQVGVERPTDRGWPLLSKYLAYVQVKDALLADRSVRAAGEGDAQVGELIAHLRDAGYRGFLALEPHLALAGRSSGFDGPSGMAYTAEALRRALAEHGCVEEPYAAEAVKAR